MKGIGIGKRGISIDMKRNGIEKRRTDIGM